MDVKPNIEPSSENSSAPVEIEILPVIYEIIRR